MIKFFRFFITILFLSLFFIDPVWAQDQKPILDPEKAQINIGNKQPYGIKAVGNPNASVGNIVSNAILIMFIFAGLAVLVFIVWGAFDWVTSGGDKEKIAAARRKIVNALIGLALLALASFIVSLFGQIVGFNPLTVSPLPRLDQAPTTP